MSFKTISNQKRELFPKFNRKPEITPLEKNESIEMFEDFYHGNHLMVSREGGEYFAGIMPTKRRLIAYFLNLSLWMHFIKCQLLYWIRDPYIRTLLADPFLLFTRGDLGALQIGFLFLMLALMGE